MEKTYGPYSLIRQAGNLYFTSGQIGVHPDTGQCADDITGQTRQALENLKAVLADAELGMEQVIKTTVYLIDMKDFSKMNMIYGEYFPIDKPARSTVAVHELPSVSNGTQLRIEIEAIADGGLKA